MSTTTETPPPMSAKKTVELLFKECLFNYLATSYASRKLGYRGRPPTFQHCRG